MSDRSGQRLGNYRLTHKLGQGGFADVYLGEHVYLGTHAAVKVLQTALSDEDDLERFLTEARTIAHLTHPHIVRVLDFGVTDETPFLVMDYAPNGTLRQRHSRGTQLPTSTIIPYVKQIAAALQYAHNAKLIHRDIKPENMLLDQHHNVLLSDFGIASVSQSSRYQNTQDIIGTAAYMSPEQIRGKPRPASDQYSLGIIVYEWLSGTRPFEGPLTEIYAQHLHAVPPQLTEKVPTIAPAVEHVLTRALAKDPKQRFKSISAFADALSEATNEQAVPPTIYEQQPPNHSLPTSPSFPSAETEKATASPTDQQEHPQIQKPKQDQHEETQYQSEKRKRFRTTAFGPQFHHQWIVCLAWLLLLTGIGTTIGALTQSWFLALAALIIGGIGSYFLGYSKALGSVSLAIPSIVSLVLTIYLTTMLAQLNYAQPMQVHYYLRLSDTFAMSYVTFVGRQLTFGLACGTITALIAIIAAVIVCPPWGKKQYPPRHTTSYKYRPQKSPDLKYLKIKHLYWFFVAIYIPCLGVMTIIAFLATSCNWGFGWTLTAYASSANMIWLGFLLGNVLLVGMGASIPIWWTAFTDKWQ
jgi:serine/threonine protein kinase